MLLEPLSYELRDPILQGIYSTVARFIRAPHHEPHWAPAWFQRWALGRAAWAAQYVADRDEHDTEAWFLAGALLRRIDRPAEALARLTQAALLAGADPNIAVEAAWAAIESEVPGQALEAIDRLGSGATDYRAWYVRGMALLLVNRLNESVDSFERAQALGASAERVYAMVALIRHIQAGRIDRPGSWARLLLFSWGV